MSKGRIADRLGPRSSAPALLLHRFNAKCGKPPGLPAHRHRRALLRRRESRTVEARPRCPRMINVSAAVLTVCFSLQWIPNVDAGIAVSPLQQEVIARPGGEVSFLIQLKNVQRTLSPSPEEVRLEVVDFAVSPDGAIGFGPETAHNRSAKNWIQLDADRIVLEPGEARQVKSTVTVPHSASGDHWAAVMMTFGPPKTQAGVNVVLRTASGVFVRVAG